MHRTFKGRYLAFILPVVLAWIAALPAVMGAQDTAPQMSPVLSSPQEPKSQDPRVDKQQNPTIKIVSKLVVTPVTVIDRDGQFVYGLTERDFQIFDNGVAQRLESFESEGRPVALVVVVKTSRSVEGLLEQVRPLGSVFSSLVVGPQGQAAVVTFSDRVHVAQDFSGDSDQLTTVLRRMVPDGDGSRLNDAMMRAVALLERRPETERRVVVAFSSGFDSGSESSSKEVIRRATGSEVTVYGLGFSPVESLLTRNRELSGPGPLDANLGRPTPPGMPPTPSISTNVYDAPIPVVDILTAAGQVVRSTIFSNLLEYYSGYTGGIYTKHWKKKTVEDQVSRIASEIHSQYELAYVPDTLSEEGFHKIVVKVNGPGWKVRARAGYFYQAPTAPASAPAAATSHAPK